MKVGVKKIRYMCKKTTGNVVKVKIYKSKKDGLVHRRQAGTKKAVPKKKKLYKTRAQAKAACKRASVKKSKHSSKMPMMLF